MSVFDAEHFLGLALADVHSQDLITVLLSTGCPAVFGGIVGALRTHYIAQEREVLGLFMPYTGHEARRILRDQGQQSLSSVSFRLRQDAG